MADQSSEAFTEEEVRLILRAADSMTHRLNGYYDAAFTGQLVRFYLHFGVHPSVLSGLPDRPTESQDPSRVGEMLPAVPPIGSSAIEKRPLPGGKEEWFLCWQRPKTKKGVVFPVPDEDRPWIENFLDRPKPVTPSGYLRILDKVEWQITAASGYKFSVNPRRFRHTAALRLLKAGVLPTTVQRLLRVSPETLELYAKETPQDVAKQLRQIGWGH